MIGDIHSDQVIFWEAGKLASPGIKQMAETDGTGTLTSELQAAIQTGTASTVLSGGTPSGTVTIESFEVSQAFPQVTLTSMIAPSPDWFIGVHGVSLLDD